MRKFAILIGMPAAVLMAGLSGSYVLPLDHAALQYDTQPVSDPVVQVNRKLASGEIKLSYSPEFGYLPAVLDAFGIPRESQVLVFSKTSFSGAAYRTRTPRASTSGTR